MSRFICCLLESFPQAMGLVLLILVGPVTMVQAQTSVAATNSEATGNVEDGKRSFENYACSSCHGFAGHGGVEVGAPRVATTTMTQAAFTSYVREAGVSSMPRFTAETLPDSALEDIYAFLKSIPTPPDASSIPLLSRD